MTATGPAPGWYPDPGGVHSVRWWDGAAWATHVYDHPGSRPTPVVDADPRVALPLRAAGWAVGGLLLAFVASIVVSVIVAVVIDLTGLPGDRLLIISLFGEAALWAVLFGTCITACRRWGTGSIRADLLGERPGGKDLARGLGLQFLGRIIGIALLIPITALSRRFVGSNIPKELSDGGTARVVVLLGIATIGAPIFEELFFRGLVLRALQSRLPTALAITGQALLFGLSHEQPQLGFGFVSVLASTASLGAVFGWAATKYHRLGPGMAGHAIYNGLSLALFLSLRP